MARLAKLTAADRETLRAGIYAVLAAEPGQSVRHVFYRTVGNLPGLVPKSDSGYRRVQHQVLEMRRDGSLPWYWIVDHTRAGWHVAAWETAEQFLDEVAGRYRADLWAPLDTLVEVWAESDSIAAVMGGICRRLGVSLYPCRGFASDSFLWEAADKVRRTGKERLTILYVGDYDPSGVLIDQTTRDKLAAHLPPWVVLDWRRLAITTRQIDQYDLPTRPRKPSEKRRPDILLSVEAEALPVAALRRLVQTEIESYLPAGHHQATLAAEESERELLLNMVHHVDAFRTSTK